MNNTKIQVRDLRNGDWLWTNKKILFSQYLSASDFKVYCGLASYAGNKDQRSWPSMITLATNLNMSKSTILRSLKVLEACKLVRVDRRDGTSNLYSLLEVDEIQAPGEIAEKKTKSQSPHHRLIAFFHDYTQKSRGIKPLWSAREAARLKQILAMEILSEHQIQQLMIYFLAAPSFKKFNPSISVLFSAGIFNGLQNAMQNDPNFWKNLDTYSRDVAMNSNQPNVNAQRMREMVARLSEKLSFEKTNKQHDAILHKQ